MIVAVILFLASAGMIYFACEFLLKVIERLTAKRVNAPVPMVHST
jgi:hypothetical protein